MNGNGTTTTTPGALFERAASTSTSSALVSSESTTAPAMAGEDRQLHRLAFEPQSFEELRRAGEFAMKSGLLPKGIQNWQAAILIAWQGRELGLSTVQAWRSIHVIDGLPSLSSQLMHALIVRSPDCAIFEVVETTPERCVVEAKRRGDSSTLRVIWTLERAGHLRNRNNWKNDPEAMLRSRAVGEAARARFPHVVLGLVTTDEAIDAASSETVAAEPPVEARVELQEPESVVDVEAVTEEPPEPEAGLKAKLRARAYAAAAAKLEEIREDLVEVVGEERAAWALRGIKLSRRASPKTLAARIEQARDAAIAAVEAARAESEEGER